MENEIIFLLKSWGAHFVYFTAISCLNASQNKHFPVAILFGIPFTPGYLQKVTASPDYVQEMIKNNKVNEDEFHLKEIEYDGLADKLAAYLNSKGFSSYSQSEGNIMLSGYYDQTSKTTPLPHKTIGKLAGLGWIGKNNLLVTPQFGCAICMCTVLTNAPLKSDHHDRVTATCGNCTRCLNSCPTGALKGNTWNINTTRDQMIDIDKCNSCMKCMVFCPWTLKYMNKNRRS